jgi:hypothetical protein
MNGTWSKRCFYFSMAEAGPFFSQQECRKALLMRLEGNAMSFAKN